MSLYDRVFANADVHISCPNCQEKFNIKAGQIGSVVACPSCSQQIKLNTKGNTLDDIRTAADKLENFKKN